MSAPSSVVPNLSPPVAQRRPTLMSYAMFILVGCCLCASLVGSLL
ncbi:hypothetical protein [Brevundimonas subvibrioides]|uniref:Uncharacterized protein n=1 Tax=Brevundimonas subvibrioides (strain ATCC 15264 / DSM 4735 / LMG 14903 / NBRC 16000 / CB 81) TaxID=633149 RepID=D9QFR9_BRESC|nr:hypothetical protein [Brevundimonas subvibrioides]ADL00633.1 hypothetical protein Bresu_1321 [Brevundimonas subvibrioides ATCC 15264]